jgi:hypothetical protein
MIEVIDKLLLNSTLIRLFVAFSNIEIANVWLTSISDVRFEAARESLQH